jgi:hypothetical protein
VLAGLGVLAGMAVGAALLGLVVGAVQLTAAGAAAVPPLVAIVPWTTWAAGALAFAALVAAGVGVLTCRGPAGRGSTARVGS